MNHFQLVTRAAHIGATIAAAVVAFGATIGFHDMTGSWLLAILGGVGIASVLAVGWYMVITTGSRARRLSVKVSTASIGAVLVFIALGTSGWALATAIGGKQALSSYQSRFLSEFEIALSEANASVKKQEEFVDIVSQHAAATRGLGAEEGRSGEGPLFRSYIRTGEQLDSAAKTMRETLAAGDVIYAAGLRAIDNAQSNLGSDTAFSGAMSDVSRAITRLNAIDVSQEILSIGMVGLNDRGLPELDRLTSSLRDAAGEANKELISLPRYMSLSRSEATIHERPMGAWIAAASIDIAPFIMLLIVMLTAGEPLMRQDRKLNIRVSDEEIRVSEANVIGFKTTAFE